MACLRQRGFEVYSPCCWYDVDEQSESVDDKIMVIVTVALRRWSNEEVPRGSDPCSSFLIMIYSLL